MLPADLRSPWKLGDAAPQTLYLNANRHRTLGLRAFIMGEAAALEYELRRQRLAAILHFVCLN